MRRMDKGKIIKNCINCGKGIEVDKEDENMDGFVCKDCLPKEGFNLSERMDNCVNSIMIEEAIEEFIKVCLADGWDRQAGSTSEDFKAGVQFMKETMVRYAGDKFIENGKRKS
jgi:hypothetical protein